MNKAQEDSFLGMTPRFMFLAMMCTSPVLAGVAYFVDFGHGETAWLCTAMLVVAVRARWELRTHVWFWATAALLLVSHIPAVVFLPWTRSHPGWSMAPVAALDFGIDYGFIKLVEKVMTPKGEACTPN